MKGRGTAGVGILVAVALIVWAVSNSRPQPESPASVSNTIEATTTALGTAYGAALGGQLALAEAAPGPQPLDEEALRAVLTSLMEEAGISGTQEQIQGVINQYRSIAAQAQGLLSQVPAGGLGALSGGGTQIDPNAVLAALVSQLVGTSPVSKAPAALPAAKAPAEAPAIIGSGGNQAPAAPFSGPEIDINSDRLESELGGMRERMSQMEDAF